MLNVPTDVAEEAVAALCQEKGGDVVAFGAAHEPDLGSHKGFVVVVFAERDAVSRAMAALQGYDLHGVALTLRLLTSLGPDFPLLTPAGAPIAIPVALGNRLFVGSVPPQVTPAHIQDMLEPYGPIRSVSLVPPTPGTNAPHAGMGFVEFAIAGAVAPAIAELDGLAVGSSKLVFATANPSAGPPPNGSSDLTLYPSLPFYEVAKAKASAASAKASAASAASAASTKAE